MSLAQLEYPAPTPEGMEEWMFNNYLAHVAINQQAAKIGLKIGTYLIYPTDFTGNPRDFLEQHQLWHSDMDAALGISGNDLSDVDFNDDKQKDAWFFIHNQEHLAAVTLLGNGL